MDRSEKIAAAAQRAAKFKVEATHRAAQAAMHEAARRGILQSSMHVMNVERVCVDGYREMCNAAALTIAEIEGEDAPQHAARLREILREAQAELLSISRRPVSGGAMKNFIDGRRPHIQAAFDEILEGTVADLELGIAGGVNVRKQKTGVSIDNRGGSGQFLFDSPNASQAVGRDQVAGGSIDLATLIDILRRVREEVGTAEIAPDARNEIEDAIVNAEREIMLPSPDPSRTRRLFRALCARLEQFGISVAGSVVASYLQSKGL
jgi:hypothetical protein